MESASFLNDLSIQEGAVEGAKAAVNGKFIAVSILLLAGLLNYFVVINK